MRSLRPAHRRRGSGAPASPGVRTGQFRIAGCVGGSRDPGRVRGCPVNRNLFWIEHEHDRMAASDSLSRYGVYVRQRIYGGFAECWDGTFETQLAERFAALAWHTATAPVMAPPYANWRSPVLSAKLGLD